MKIDTQLVHTDLSRSIFIRGGESRFMTYCVKSPEMNPTHGSVWMVQILSTTWPQ